MTSASLPPAFAELGGITAIEASAGTGKTFTITQLYLRLVLETGLDVASILVVTYTRAATAELRRRIRERLIEARQVFATGRSDDAFYTELLRRVPDRGAADAALARALQGFDEAAIFTIHGFCQRLLAERAFESGVAFDAELVPDQQDLLLEVVDDFWRTHLHGAAPMLMRHLLGKHWTPEWLRAELRGYLSLRDAHVAAPRDPDLGPLEFAFTTTAGAVREQWAHVRTAVAEALRSAGLKGNAYGKGVVDRALAEMDALAENDAASPVLFAEFRCFTTAYLVASTKKGGLTPTHPFFATCDALANAAAALAAAYDDRGAALRAQLITYAVRELAARKVERGIQFYDDLLSALDQALADPVRGPLLGEAVRRRYRAALIDEFQDTDQVQYEVVRRLYGGTQLPVVLVGDPKQAIYSFRGADVFSYLRARHDAAHETRLDVNWRADAPLVRAVNAVFGARARPFLIDGIPFVASKVAPGRPATALSVGDDDAAPLRMWWLADEGHQIDKGKARERIARATAGEIARLIALGRAGRATCGDARLEGGHIAVLVRTNEEGRKMREALLARGVPSVQQAVDSVFASREAEELERVLVAVADPGQGSLVRAALTTTMLGGSADDIERLQSEDTAWEERVEAFHEHHHRWQTHGFVRMLRGLVVREGVAERLLAFPDGERRLTNLFHLSELLQAHVSRRRGGMDALVEWMADEREAAWQPQTSADEFLLRLESDAALVKIVTVHKAKGLQYPIVFCPFLWDGHLYATRSESVACHEPGTDGVTLDLGSTAMRVRRELARAEELAERVRLLYVALTRAEHRCYVVWGKVKGGGTSPLAWLLHGGEVGNDLAALEKRYTDASDTALRAEVLSAAARAEGTIVVTPLPDDVAGVRLPAPDTDRAQLRARRLVHPLRPGWSIESFSALVAGGGERERPDYDQRDTASREAPAVKRDDVFGFPRGARAGRCLHAILETTDFTAPDPAIVPAKLRAFGIDVVWAPVVVEWIARVLATPLDAGGRLRLCDVPRVRRLDELEFYYPAERLDVRALCRALADAGFAAGAFREAAAQLGGATVRGFVKGFIDCVIEHDGRYVVVDYKSNWLGGNREAYAASGLVPVVAREQYWLQYLLYTLAIHRHLARRLPDYDYDRHMGGVRYLFLRGMDPAHGSGFGVYADHPSRAVVELLDAHLGGLAR